MRKVTVKIKPGFNYRGFITKILTRMQELNLMGLWLDGADYVGVNIVSMRFLLKPELIDNITPVRLVDLTSQTPAVIKENFQKFLPEQQIEIEISDAPEEE